MAIKTCMECGCQIPAKPAKKGPVPKFCGQACSKTFNNRRMTRGAELYDLLMAGRFQRETHAGMWRPTMSVLATHFHDKDKRERDGRQSWHTPDPLGDPRALSR